MKSRIYMFALMLAAFVLPGGEALAAHKHHGKGKTAKAVKAGKAARAAKTSLRAHKVSPVKRDAAPAKALSYAEISSGKLKVQSSAVVVQDQATGQVLYEKNPDAVLPIASISKLMTAMVTLDARPDLQEPIAIADADVDVVKRSSSHLPVGTQLSREMMLRLALMSSENRASHALSRTYPGGEGAFVAAMNRKAEELGLKETRFFDPTGLNSGNVSSARDLARMVAAAAQYPLIREFSTTAEYQVPLGRRVRMFHNTNALVRNGTWEIGVSKTGYINESGKCLVMQAFLNNKPTIIVLLDSWGKLTRIGDANRIKRWLEANAGTLSKTSHG